MAATTSASATPNSSSSIGFQNYNQNQDLRLSLQSFQDPIFHGQNSSTPSAHQTIFANSANLAFDAGSAMAPWNAAGPSGGYVFNVAPPMQAVLSQGQFFAQRGPLQSSNSPSFRAWTAEPITPATTDHQMQPGHNSSFSAIGFASGAGFSGFRIPARIQGDEEHGGGVANKPPSASRH
ncbi:transcription factor PCF5-like [Typha latifolia]|uniref:transcription factor PCF5-like n=1 Tax=Typha latifolia TaxID=4733 RepID=UPI003C2D1293